MLYGSRIVNAEVDRQIKRLPGLMAGSYMLDLLFGDARRVMGYLIASIDVYRSIINLKNCIDKS